MCMSSGRAVDILITIYYTLTATLKEKGGPENPFPSYLRVPLKGQTRDDGRGRLKREKINLRSLFSWIKVVLVVQKSGRIAYKASELIGIRRNRGQN